MKNIQKSAKISRTDLKMGNYKDEQISVETDKPSKTEDLHKALADLVFVIFEMLKNRGG